MRCARRFPPRLVRWTSLGVSLALVLSCFILTPLSNPHTSLTVLAQGQGSRNGKPKKEKPVTGPPAASLPNLDEVKRRGPEAPRVPQHVPSTLRSRRKPLEPRNGRKVGDPLPPRKASTNLTRESSERVNVASADKHGLVGTVRTHHARTPRSLPAGVERSSSHATLIRLMDLTRGSLSHSTFAFLRYPSLHSDSNAGPTSTIRSNAYELSLSPNAISTTGFDFMVAAMPQSGSSKIAFASNRDGSLQIYVMNADGTGQTRLTSNGSNNDSPRWSPNGTKILFQSDRDNPGSGSFDIYLMNADGSGQTRLTTDANDDSAAVWSPDGTKIAFQSLRNGSWYQVYSMNADGSNQLNLTNTSFSESQPSWSPDGTKIAFASERDRPGFKSVHVMNSNGSNQHRVTFSSGEIEDTQPAWSRDGSKIAFVSTRDSTLETWQETDDDGNVLNRSKLHLNKEIYLMNVDGSGQTRLTNELANDDSPSWSPDGSKIVFRSDRERDWSDPSTQVWTMNADGSSQIDLSNSVNGDYSASWASGSANQPPVANAGGPYNGVTAQSISFNGGSSFDPDGSITSYAWNFGDGGTGSGVSSSHAYTTAGTYNVSLVVTDNSGATASAAATATITQANQPPIANAGGPYNAVTAQSISFNGGGSFDPDGSITSYAWNFGDGGTGSGLTPAHAYATVGTYTVTLTVTDNQGAQASATTNASVTTATADFFTQNFIQVALNRTPNQDEVNYWEDIFRAAYAHQQGSMMIAVREMARTVFESAEYAGRGRDNHWYVYDLYETYLMRYPDAPGWGFWEGQCNTYGREQVRRAFDECGEFAGNVAAIQPTGSVSSSVYSLQSSRVNPENQTGNQLLARDAEWSASLLSLPGRAGLDLGLGLSYSSNVWTRSGPYAYFDEDNGTLSPGFRLGFPTVQEVFFDAQVGVNVRVLITGSGQRVELRQIGTTNVYEAADSSYLQLTDYGNSLTVSSTDGTQMSYAKLQDEWRCTQIKDRNGNLITIVNDWRGDIQTITDTLGRVISFNYDANANLASITQAGRTEPWVTFGWGTTRMHPIAGASVVGTHDNEDILVLSFVGFPDGSYYRFIYTTAGSGQVSRITHYASDSDPQHDTHELAHTDFNYNAADDSTRLASTAVTAENWTSKNGVPSTVVTRYGIEGAGHTVSVDDDPNTTVYKESYGTGWQRGLVVSAEVRSGGAPQKTTTTTWAKDDNTSNNFATNPRVIQADIIDSAQNHTRMTIDYGPYAEYGLPNVVTESSVANNVVTELRRSYTDYKLTQPYLERRIIGLVSTVRTYDPITSQWQTKATYDYDAPASIQSQAKDAIQHDQDFDENRLVRGNVTSISRWDTSDIDNESKKLTTNIGYNSAGSVLSSSDPLGHTTNVSYEDKFAANGITLDQPRSFATWAYPTKVIDTDGYSSSLRYRYDFGAATWKQTPKPNETTNSTLGPEQKLEYDSVTTRLQRVTSLPNGAYARYEYGPNFVHTLSTVNNVADEAYSAQIFDGLGRVIASAHNHPTINGGGYSAVVTVYDLMGRAIRQSNPTDTSTAGQQWPATGDDAPNDWIYTQQTYDWKGRPLITTNPSITANPNDTTTKEASYSVCGCAGNEMVTLEDEVRRIQKVYTDGLGRQWKTEILNPDSTVYSTNVSVYNGRDQIVRVKQYSGAAPTEASSTNEAASCPTSSCQESTMSYDGYGRLQRKHVPEQSANTATVYDYNADDTILSVTDARGASAAYGYNNNRGLVNTITYSAPEGVATTSNPSFTYDAVGNRKSMTDGLGNKSYTYNQLSQLMSETRTFTNVGMFTLSYDYNLAGELKFVKDHTNAQINYGYNNAGELQNVTGTNYSTTEFLSNVTYRAWGAPKEVSYGNGRKLSLGYDQRLQVKHFEIPAAGSLPSVMNLDYQYNDDGRLSYSHNQLDSRFDRGYQYDHVGRIKLGLSGPEASGGTPTTDRPYREFYAYDAFDHLTVRNTRHWSKTQPYISSDTYTDNRRNGWQYDAEGNLTNNITRQYTYDAAGRMSTVSGSNLNQFFDGDGQRVKTTEPNLVTYYLRSSVLGGQVIEELDGSGDKQRGFVYAGGKVIAEQAQDGFVGFVHEEPSGTSVQKTHGVLGTAYEPSELDPFRQDTELGDPYLNNPAYNGRGEGGPLFPGYGNITDPGKSCTLDGVYWPCELAYRDMGSGAFNVDYIDPTARTGARRKPVWVPDNSSTAISNFGGTQDSSVTIYASNGGHFEWVPDPDQLEKSIIPRPLTPQNTGAVGLGGIDQLKKLIEQTSSSCREAVQRLLGEIAAETGSELTSTDPIEMFNQITSQTGGGGILVDITLGNRMDRLSKDALRAYSPGPSGSGEAWHFWSYSEKNVQRIAIIYLRYSTGTAQSKGLIMAAYLVTAFHEMAHIARKDHKPIEHSQMNLAAVNLGALSFDDYIEKHCIDRKYWAR